jgi:ribosome-associated protein
VNKEFINKNFDKIMKDGGFDWSKNLALAATWVFAHFKGEGLKIIDAREQSSLCDFYVLVTKLNGPQAHAMVEELSRQTKRQKVRVHEVEGDNDSAWILLDLGDVIVHILSEEGRRTYDLDGLWKELPLVSIPKEYFFSTDVGESART